MTDEEALINSVFMKLDTYGLNSLVPGVKDISAMKSLLSIGGVLLFIPYMDEFAVSYRKDPSTLDANNNSVYSDGYVQRPTEIRGKSFVPKEIDLVSYAALYTVFRSVYRSSEVADAGDIVLNSLYNWLKKWREETTSEFGGWTLDFLLGFINIIQKGFTLEQLPYLSYAESKDGELTRKFNWPERAKAGQASLTNNVALLEEFEQSRDNILSNYTTLYTGFILEKGKDIISTFNEGGYKPFGLGSFTGDKNILTVPGEFFKLFYDMVMLMYKYSNIPLPIHIPNEGWVFGTDKQVDFRKDSKAYNMAYVVDINITLQEVMYSSFINITEEKTVGTSVKQKGAAKGPCASIETLRKLGGLGDIKGINVTKENIERYCMLVSEDLKSGDQKNKFNSVSKGMNILPIKKGDTKVNDSYPYATEFVETLADTKKLNKLNTLTASILLNKVKKEQEDASIKSELLNTLSIYGVKKGN